MILDSHRAVGDDTNTPIQEQNLVLLEVSWLAVAKELRERLQVVALEERLVPHERCHHDPVFGHVQVASLSVHVGGQPLGLVEGSGLSKMPHKLQCVFHELVLGPPVLLERQDDHSSDVLENLGVLAPVVHGEETAIVPPRLVILA